VQPVFQPLIDLDNRHVVGYEALARGPMGSALETPAALFGAVRGGLGPPLTLFVNAEPVSLGVACPGDLRRPSSRARAGCGWWSR